MSLCVMERSSTARSGFVLIVRTMKPRERLIRREPNEPDKIRSPQGGSEQESAVTSILWESNR